jgi:hypothetical protein
VPIAPSASSKPWLMMVPSKTAAVTLAGIDPDAAFYALRHADVSRTQGGRAGEGRGGPWRGTSRGMIEADHAKFLPKGSSEVRGDGSACVEARACCR